MRIVALEEHIVPRLISDAWRRTLDRQDASVGFDDPVRTKQLEDVGESRLAAMADSGVDKQVLSLPPPCLNNFEAAEAIALAHDFNDYLADVVSGRPDRFDGFATLPMPDPAAAAEELGRAVTRLGLKGALLCGRVGERHMDDRTFDPVYFEAERLRAPLYIHPQMPQPAVLSALYGGFNPTADFLFATSGIGWHYEAGLQFLRMVLGGVFDRFPDLQVVLGHWGEVVLFYLDRIALLGSQRVGLNLDRPIRDYFTQNAFYTPSGMFQQHYLRWTIETVGVDRVMFSQDYPYQHAGSGGARAFLDQAAVSASERRGIAHGIWDDLSSAIAARQAPVLPSPPAQWEDE